MAETQVKKEEARNPGKSDEDAELEEAIRQSLLDSQVKGEIQ